MFIAKVKMVAAVAAVVVVTGTAVPVGIAVAQAVGREGDASSAMVVPAAAQARTGTVQAADATNSAPWEVTLSAEDYKKLNVEEGALLAKADKAFADKEYLQATALYDSFTTQFPKSAAVVYAMVRKARSLQYDNHRLEALRTYVEVMDYYPDRIPYAAAALYYIGECHYANGATNEALKAWAEMTKDADYRKHVATGLINHLADNLVALGKWPAAVVYYEQIHNDFRPGNLQEANYARSRLLYYYTQVRSNVDQALALANELVKAPGYAKDTYLIRAGLYRSKKMYKEAINDYMMADQPPGTFYAIAECYVEWGKPSMAITQLSEIESFFPAESSRAALEIAYVYRTTKQQDKYVAALRGVLKKYSGPHSSTAHQLLQAMGNKPGGAEEVK